MQLLLRTSDVIIWQVSEPMMIESSSIMIKNLHIYGLLSRRGSELVRTPPQYIRSVSLSKISLILISLNWRPLSQLKKWTTLSNLCQMTNPLVAAVEHGVPLMRSKWVHHQWAHQGSEQGKGSTLADGPPSAPRQDRKSVV